MNLRIPRMRTVPRLALSFFVAAVVAEAAQVPPPSTSPIARERMKALEFLIGEWEGEAWMQMGPGQPETVAQQERVEWAAGGEVLVIRGLGRQGGRVVHDAVGTIAWDSRSGRYTMWTYRAGTGASTPDLTVEPGVVVWGLATPGAEIRFTMRLDAEGRWTEKGERSTDGGKTWVPVFDIVFRPHRP
jgi:hypothetical protein